MGEKTTTCPGCNRTMLQSTADEHNGFCVPCSRNPAVAMTEDFRLDDEITAKLLAIGEDPDSDRFRGMQWQFGRDFLSSSIDRKAGLARENKERAARLIAFIDSRRLINGRPKHHADPSNGLTNKASGIYTIIEEMFTQGIWKNNGVSLFIVPLVALRAGEAFRDARCPESIVLTHDEWKEWLDACPDHNDKKDWYTYSYNVHTDRDSFREIMCLGIELGLVSEEDTLADLNADETPWIVTFNFHGGPDFSNGYTALWGWNGKQPRFVSNLSSFMS